MRKNIMLGILFLCLHFIAVLFINDLSKVNLITVLYLLLTIVTFGLAYLDTVNIMKLGFGITRKTIYIKFSKNLVIYIGMLFIFSVYNALIYKIVYKDMVFLDILNLGMILYFSVNIFCFGQIGLLFGNIRINKIFGSVVFLILLTTSFLLVLVFDKYIIVNIILFIIGLSLVFVNYKLVIKGKFKKE